MGLEMEWYKIILFNNKYFPSWRSTEPIYYSNAIAGETGEICNAIKHSIGGGTNKHPVSKEDILEEIADLFIYMELLTESMGYNDTDLSEAITKKTEKNEQRMKSRQCNH